MHRKQNCAASVLSLNMINSPISLNRPNRKNVVAWAINTENIMISRLGKLGFGIAAVAGTGFFMASPAHAAAPVCSSMDIVIPNIATATIPVSEGMILSKCTDADGDTLHVTSPTVPYTIYVQPGQWYTFVHTVSDGHGGTTTQTIYIRRY
jgi:hypothetical protein